MESFEELTKESIISMNKMIKTLSGHITDIGKFIGKQVDINATVLELAQLVKDQQIEINNLKGMIMNVSRNTSRIR